MGLGLLLSLLMLIAGSFNASAQVNTGSYPYLNSWHSYRVEVGDGSNTRQWDIVNEDESITRDLSSTTHLWSSINSLDGTYADINIFYTDTLFAVGDIWYLRYREYSADEGTCVAARQFTIEIFENDFYLSLDDDVEVCKTPYDGMVCSWDTINDATETFNTSFTYRVTLNKDSDYEINGWSFEATIDLTPVGHNHTFNDYTLEVVPVSEGTATLVDDGSYGSDLDGYFKASMSGLTTATLSSVAVDVVVTVNGLLYEGVTASLTLENGQAIAGVNNNITLDNEDRPVDADGVTDVNLQDRLKVVIINPLPATHDISYGSSETAWSAANPLQYSTHNYTVEMGDATNAYSWALYESDGTTLVVNDAANYEIVDNGLSADINNVDFTFNMGNGTYYIEFTETGTCTSVRRYTITLGDPFDVDITAASNTCAEISGDVNDDFTFATTTDVTYVIDLITENYKADWSFDFTLASIPVFDAADVEVSSITASDGTYSGDTSTGTVTVANSEASPISQVTVTVTYSGIYSSLHTITATINDCTGSFNEVDADTSGDDITTHIIYRMPQPLALEGVD
jgi:hypothetical protein